MRQDPHYAASRSVTPDQARVVLAPGCRAYWQAGRVSVNRRLALILYGLVREFMPRHAVEMGSSVGISGSYQATALRHAGAGRLLVLEGTPDLAAVASETHAELGLDVEIDGHHDGRATVEYFEQILPRSERAACVRRHPLVRRMSEAWRTIANDARVSFAVDARRFGLAFTGPPKRELRLPSQRRRARPSDLVARS